MLAEVQGVGALAIGHEPYVLARERLGDVQVPAFPFYLAGGLDFAHVPGVVVVGGLGQACGQGA